MILPVCMVTVTREGGFWMTSGCYPQELVIALSDAASVGVIKTVTTNGTRRMIVRMYIM